MLFRVNAFTLHMPGNAASVHCQPDARAKRGPAHSRAAPRVRSWLVGTAKLQTARGFNC